MRSTPPTIVDAARVYRGYLQAQAEAYGNTVADLERDGLHLSAMTYDIRATVLQDVLAMYDQTIGAQTP